MAPSLKLAVGSCTTFAISTYGFTPKPSQPAHAPAGLLKVNNLGSKSGMLYPHLGQAILELKALSSS